ncbi:MULTISPECIES: Flp family type IVb pilin [unclassified Thioalkalivibrio]|uniref:Flp family type IVb pilin n=1 Tax=unclassified Thioalkalivibrio TaxID=2621013 RepID=UPI000376CEA5|nr:MULTISPECIES: Flp family type IVb pilin [unclassified Thioalkalivibrio]
MKYFIRNLWNDEEGASAIEYALIAALIAVAIAGAVTLAGEEIEELFDTIVEEIGGAGEG